jgi:hypothetical protein
MNYLIPAGTQKADELARRLAALWAPARPVAEPHTDDDLDDECTGYGGCDCSSCVHDDRVRTARCQLGRGTGPSGCDEPTQYRLRLWRPGPGSQVQRHELGLTDDPDQWVEFSEDRVFLTGSERYACGKPHAHQLAGHLRAHYARPDDTELTRYRVLVEPWRYEPDEYDLGGSGLLWLQTLATAAAADIGRLIDQINPHAVSRGGSARFWLDDARRDVAELARGLAELDTRPLPQRRYVDSIPPEVRAVQTERDGGAYFLRGVPIGPASGWFHPGELTTFGSDAELLAAYPDGLYEPHGSELVLPEPAEDRA